MTQTAVPRHAANGHVILSHGMESGPNATKVARLAALAESLGCSAQRVDDVGIVDPQHRLQRLLPLIDAAPRPRVLMGSSLGAYVSGRASLLREVDALFLLAPPVHLPPPHAALSLRAPRIVIVHGWRDELIAAGDVFDLAANTRAALHLVDADHRLGEAMDVIEREFASLLAGLERAAA